MRDDQTESGALPRSVRISCQLVDILLLANAIREELAGTDAAPLRWIAPEIDAVLGKTDGLLRRFAS